VKQKRNRLLRHEIIIWQQELLRLFQKEGSMKLKISNKEFWDKVFSRQETPIYVDKADYYDMEKLLSWEKRFDEIKVALNSQDKQKGIEALFELAEEGYPEARRLLSDMYIEGKDLPESFSKAVEWDRRAQYADRLFVHKRKLSPDKSS